MLSQTAEMCKREDAADRDVPGTGMNEKGVLPLNDSTPFLFKSGKKLLFQKLGAYHV